MVLDGSRVVGSQVVDENRESVKLALPEPPVPGADTVTEAVLSWAGSDGYGRSS